MTIWCIFPVYFLTSNGRTCILSSRFMLFVCMAPLRCMMTMGGLTFHRWILIASDIGGHIFVLLF